MKILFAALLLSLPCNSLSFSILQPQYNYSRLKPSTNLNSHYHDTNNRKSFLRPLSSLVIVPKEKILPFFSFLSNVKKWKNIYFYQGSVLWDWTGATVLRCWIVLFISIIIEIKATTLIKVASDNSDLKLMISAVSLYAGSLFGFAVALKKIEVSVAYAVWSAIGTVVVSLAGIFMFGESCDYKKVISLAMIMLGVVGLNLQDGGH